MFGHFNKENWSKSNYLSRSRLNKLSNTKKQPVLPNRVIFESSWQRMFENGQNILWLLGHFEKHIIKVKFAATKFGQPLEKLGCFLFQHLVTLPGMDHIKNFLNLVVAFVKRKFGPMLWPADVIPLTGGPLTLHDVTLERFFILLFLIKKNYFKLATNNALICSNWLAKKQNRWRYNFF